MHEYIAEVEANKDFVVFKNKKTFRTIKKGSTGYLTHKGTLTPDDSDPILRYYMTFNSDGIETKIRLNEDELDEHITIKKFKGGK